MCLKVTNAPASSLLHGRKHKSRTHGRTDAQRQFTVGHKVIRKDHLELIKKQLEKYTC